MRAFVVTLWAGLLLMVALAGLTGCGGADFGVSGTAPIGSVSGVEGYLADKKLARSDLPADQAKPLFGDWVTSDPALTFVRFADSVPSYRHHVVLAKKDGKLVALVAEFRSSSFTFSTVGTKVESFAARLWKQVAGSEATFETKLDRGLGMREYMIATAAKGKVRVSWRKDSQDADMKNSQGVVDKVVFRVE